MLRKLQPRAANPQDFFVVTDSVTAPPAESPAISATAFRSGSCFGGQWLAIHGIGCESA
jgi:hypothetical protein